MGRKNADHALGLTLTVEEHPAASVAAQRTSFMLGLTPARLP
jgi:hypothetical protein